MSETVRRGGGPPSSADPPAAAAPATGTEAADRVADVLLLFTAASSALGVSAISRELGLSKAVVHRILQSLTSRQLLALDPPSRGYRLGAGAAALGARALRQSDLRRAALPVLRRLRDATGETTTVSKIIADERVYLDQFESQREIKMTVEVGRRFPLHAGSSSRVILAFLPTDRQLAVLARPLVALTPSTITDAATLRRALQEIREDRTSVSCGERQDGAGSVAAPVFGFDGQVVGAISVCGPVQRFDDDTCRRLRPLVRSAAEDISRQLGWDGVLPAHDEEPLRDAVSVASR